MGARAAVGVAAGICGDRMVLEARGAKTVLTLVQNGFLGNEDWENECFAIQRPMAGDPFC
jgi:hypothetical protein